jgi:hypothetical protein
MIAMADGRPRGDERDVESRRADNEVDSLFAALFTVDGVLADTLDVALTEGYIGLLGTLRRANLLYLV